MGTKEELDAMLDSLERSVPTSDAPIEEEAAQLPDETPPADGTKPDEVSKEETSGDDDQGGEGKTEPPATSTPESEVDKLRREIEELKAITKLKEEKPQATEPPIEDKDFVKDIDLEDLIRDPAEFNKVLNNIYRQARIDSRNEIRKVSEDLPTKVTSRLEEQRLMKEVTDNFYNSNPDLKKFPKVVGAIFEEIANENKGKPLATVLEMVGEETRKRLELKKPEAKAVEPKDKSKSDDGPPPLPRKKGGRINQPKSDPDSIISEIDAMNRVVVR